MKRMLVYCITPGCNHVHWSMEWNMENPEFTLIETTGAIDGHELCEKCRKELENKPVFNNPKPIRFGEENTENFDDMMAKRKLEARKKSGKGPGRGNR